MTGALWLRIWERCCPGSWPILRRAVRAYERKIAGYTAPEAILTGLETRTSSPVRLKREETLESASWRGCTPAARGPDMRAAL